MNGRIRELAALLTGCPHACAALKGNQAGSSLHGNAWFYRTQRGVLIAVQMYGLPEDGVFGMHIHSGSNCEDPQTHFSKEMEPHPFHAGDMPPLFGNKGYAFSAFLTERFTLPEVIGKTIILHRNRDDFTTQPSGDSGKIIACGVISCR